MAEVISGRMSSLWHLWEVQVLHTWRRHHGHAVWGSYSSPLTTEIASIVLTIFRATAAINKDFSYNLDLNNNLLAWPSFRSRKKFVLPVGARRETVFPRNSREWQWLVTPYCESDILTVWCPYMLAHMVPTICGAHHNSAQTLSFPSTSLIIFCWEEAHSWQDFGLEIASPMVILSENLVHFHIFSLNFYFLFYPGAHFHRLFEYF